VRSAGHGPGDVGGGTGTGAGEDGGVGELSGPVGTTGGGAGEAGDTGVSCVTEVVCDGPAGFNKESVEPHPTTKNNKANHANLLILYLQRSVTIKKQEQIPALSLAYKQIYVKKDIGTFNFQVQH